MRETAHILAMSGMGAAGYNRGRMLRVTTLAMALLLAAAAAFAQSGPAPRVAARGALDPVQLQFQDGRVTLRAQNAPLRAILAEWARLGGATIVNGDRVAGPPLTLELTGVPERQALDIVLRSVAGYMLAPRRAGATGASAFDRIMILPTSAAPRNPPPPAAAAARRPTPAPVLPRPPVLARPPQAGVVEQPEDAVEAEDVADAPAAVPADQIAAPGIPRPVPQPLVRPPVMPPRGVTELVPEQPDPEVAQPDTPPAVAPTPANPFGVPFGSSARPGVIAPPPQQQPQQQPANRVQ